MSKAKEPLRDFWIVSVSTGDVFVMHNAIGVGVSSGLKVFESEEDAETFSESVKNKKKRRRRKASA